MSLVLDAIVVLVLAIAVILGYKRGFISTAVQLAGYVLAFLIALSLSTTAAEFTYDRFIGEKITETVSAAFVENTGNTVSEKVDDMVGTLPDFLQTALLKNEDVQTALNDINEKTENTVAAVTETVVQKVLRPVVVALLRFVIFLILFLVLLLVVKLLSKLVKPLTKLPVIRQVDGVLGIVLGAVNGCVLSVVAVTVMQLIITAGSTVGPFTAENLQNSFLASRIAEINPLALIIKF